MTAIAPHDATHDAPRFAPAPSVATIHTQEELAALVRAGLDTLDARLRDLAATLPRERWTTPRADGGWSVGELLEHLCLANADYLRPMHAMVDAGAPARPRDGRWRASLMGGLLRRSMESTRKLPAPREIRPGREARAGVIDALVATHDEVRALMTRAAPLDWRRLRMSSPWARLVRLNFGDTCLVILRHGERHIAQAERLAATLLAAR
jgi:hypothetical protein